MIADGATESVGRPSSAPARSIAIRLFAIVIVLTTLSVAALVLRHISGGDHFRTLVRLFHVSAEANVPTWFSSMMLFSAAVLVSDIARNESRQGERRFLKHWWFLAILFLYVSLDEVAQIHEMASAPLRHRLGTGGFLYHAWVVPALIFVVALLVTYLPFLARLPLRTSMLLVLSGMVYVTGALGMELVGGYIVDHHPGEGVLRYVVTTLEESLEMCGIVLLIHALLTHRAAAGHGPASLRGLA